MHRIERAFQTAIGLSRWLAAPFLLGLMCCLLLLIYRFFADLFGLVIKLPGTGWHELVVGVLELIDVALAANLVLIVIFSGYDNFIRKTVPGEHPDWPQALLDVDFGALKQKLLGSIAGIAAIDALAWYLDLEKYPDTAKLGWVLAFPLLFVTALLMVAIADRLTRHPNRDG